MARDSTTPGSRTAEPDGHRPSGRLQHSRPTASRPATGGDGPQGDDERGERFVVERQRFATGSIAKRFDRSRDEFAGVLLAPSPPPQTQSPASSQAQVIYSSRVDIRTVRRIHSCNWQLAFGIWHLAFPLVSPVPGLTLAIPRRVPSPRCPVKSCRISSSSW